MPVSFRAPAPTRLLLGAACLVATAMAHAQDADRAPVALEEITFAPAAFQVGDVVELRILFHTRMQPSQPRFEAGGPWLVTRAAELLPRGNDRWELRIMFSVFQPGVQTLPAIDLSSFRIENIKVQADSVLSGTTDDHALESFRPLRSQVAMPGTTARILLLLLLVLVLPSLMAALIIRVIAHVRTFLAERAQTVPRRRLERSMRRQLARLDSDAEQVTPEAFFVELSHNLRGYLEATLDIPAQASTTHELHQAFARQRLGVRQGDELAEILATADRVKFAGDSAAADEMSAIGARLIELITDVETTLPSEGHSVEP